MPRAIQMPRSAKELKSLYYNKALYFYLFIKLPYFHGEMKVFIRMVAWLGVNGTFNIVQVQSHF